MKQVFVTIAANNYLPEAITLASTLRQYHPDSLIALVQPERPEAVHRSSRETFNIVLTADDLGYDNLDKFAFTHDLTELSTAMKPRAILKLISMYPKSDVIYIDPDCYLYSAMEEIEIEFDLGRHIVVTPHHLTDEEEFDGIKDNVFRTLKCGVFNLGFLAIRSSDVAVELLQWWKRKLDMLCYIDFERGLFVDQKWFDLAYTLFPISILRHEGYNVANWNVSKRHVRSSDVGWTVNSQMLRFFHFSGIRSGKDLKYIRKYDALNGTTVESLRREYKQIVSFNKKMIADKEDLWSFGVYRSGEEVSEYVRSYIRRYPNLLDRCKDPYDSSNEEWMAQF